MAARLVVISEAVLTALAARPDAVKAFPFLAGLAGRKASSCGSCGRKAPDLAKAFLQAKRAVAGLGSDQKRRLRELLKATSVRVVYPTHKGKVVALTF
jgi:hypothetical protein